MDEKFESLNTILERAVSERARRKAAELEKKGSIGDYKEADSENAKKELRKALSDFFHVIDFDQEMMRASNNCYYFSTEESQYLEYFFSNMSQLPLRELRKGEFEKVPSEEYERLEIFLEKSMRNAEKDEASIQQQMLKFRHRTGWAYRRDMKATLEETVNRLDELFKRVQGRPCFSVNNRMDVLSAVNHSLSGWMTSFCEQWSCAMDEMSEELDEKLIDNGIEMGEQAPPEYWAAMDEIRRRIEGSPQKREYMIQGKSITLDGDSAERDEELCKLERELTRCEHGRIGDAKAAAAKRKEIKERKDEIRAECFKKHGLDLETVRKIDAIGGRGHGLDDLVTKKIKATMERLSIMAAGPNWQEYKGSFGMEEGTGLVAGESTFDPEKANRGLKELLERVDQEGLKNWCGEEDLETESAMELNAESET